MKSIVSDLGPVPFPEFRHERFYMVPFVRGTALPEALARYQRTVDAMLASVATDSVLAITIDSRVVPAGTSQRAPGPHIDGYWNWGSGHGGGRHAGSANLPLTPQQVLVLQAEMIAHGRPLGVRPENWTIQDFSSPEALILAQSHAGSVAYEGDLPDGTVFGPGGTADGVDLSGLRRVRLLGGRAYAGNVTMVHASLPMAASTERCLVRICAPGWSPAAH